MDLFHSEDIAGQTGTGGTVYLITVGHPKPKHIASYFFVGSEKTAAKEVEGHKAKGRVAVFHRSRDLLDFDKAYATLPVKFRTLSDYPLKIEGGVE